MVALWKLHHLESIPGNGYFISCFPHKMGSGTVSGPGPDQAGTMIEITSAGRQPLVLPAEGLAPSESRPFLADGDTVTLRGWCQRAGAATIGLATCTGTVPPAQDPHAKGLP